MKYNRKVITVLFFIGILILTSCSAYDKATDNLTPVDNPMEYQNAYYPVEIGEINKFNHYVIEDSVKKFIKRSEREVVDYRDSDIRLGRRILNIPVFRIKERNYINDSLVSEQEEYLIKTKEGIVFTQYLNDKKNIRLFQFIPSLPSYTALGADLSDGEVSYNVTKVPYLKAGKFMRIRKKLNIVQYSTVYATQYYAEGVGLVALFVEEYGNIFGVTVHEDYDLLDN